MINNVINTSDILIFGHRGIPTLATENSLDSFRKILDNNIQGVEFDVHLTADGQLVVIHNFNTVKMTGESYEIADTDYSILSSLTIDGGEKIPLLSEVFDLLGNKVFYDIEVKSNGKNRKELTNKLVELLEKTEVQSNCIISSFDPLLLKEINKHNTGIPVSLIYCKSDELPFFLRYGLGIFLTKIDIIKPHFTQLKGFWFFLYTKIMNKKCYTWTVNSIEDFNYAVSRRCKGICSDKPHLLI